MQVPNELRYTKEHEWARTEGGLVTVGITDFAQHQLTDVVYVDLPKKGVRVARGKVFGTVESVKSVSELYAPITGSVEDVNGALQEEPERVNQEPYGSGWMIKIRPADAKELEALLDAAAYRALTEG